MIRIYFDTNVFINLESNEAEIFKELNEALKLYKNNLTFFFSHAHIRDKKKATDEKKKAAYFKFVETIVADNYIHQYSSTERSRIFLATPTMVFDQELPEFDLNSLFTKSENDDIVLSSLRDLILNLQVPINKYLFENIPDADNKVLHEIFPLDKEVITVSDIMQRMVEFWQKLLTDNTAYKELRKYIDGHLNNGKYADDNAGIDFNEAFKNSFFNKTFSEFVENSFNSSKQVPYYDYYLQSYSMLDMLCISKEKITKKNGLNNMSVDGLHSYYAQSCDYFITDDESLLRKSKALYNLHGIETKILNVSEFLDILPAIASNTENSVEDFIEKFIGDVKHGVRGEPEIYADGITAMVIQIPNKYFNLFDQMIQITLPTGAFFFTLVINNDRYIPIHRELETTVNWCMRLFGIDAQCLGTFSFDEEIDQIKRDEWVGRVWQSKSLEFCLKKIKGTHNFFFQIGPFYYDEDINSEPQLDTNSPFSSTED